MVERVGDEVDERALELGALDDDDAQPPAAATTILPSAGEHRRRVAQVAATTPPHRHGSTPGSTFRAAPSGQHRPGSTVRAAETLLFCLGWPPLLMIWV